MACGGCDKARRRWECKGRVRARGSADAIPIRIPPTGEGTSLAYRARWAARGPKASVVAGAAVVLMCLPASALAERVTVYYYTDPQGTILAVTDATGNIIERRDHKPYGTAMSAGSDGPGYTGHVADVDSSLIYMQQRYYDPSIGRFLSPDPLRQDVARMGRSSRYGYADGNPFSHIDPDGKETLAVGLGGSASWLGGVAAQGSLTFSYRNMNPTTWRLGVFGSAGGLAGSELGTGISGTFSWSRANSAEEMASDGGDASAGAAINIGPVSVGYERSMCSDCLPMNTLFLGTRLTPLPVELHTSVTRSAGSTLIGSKPGTPTVVVGDIQEAAPPMRTVSPEPRASRAGSPSAHEP